MKAFNTSLSVAALSLIALPATAEITAQELWADWQAMSAFLNNGMTAEVSETANGLVLRNLTMRPDVGEDASTEMQFEQIELIETGSGGVEIVVSQPYRSVVETQTLTETLVVEMLASFDGLDVMATGSPNNITYMYTLDGMTYSVTQLSGPSGASPTVSMVMTTEGFETTYTVNGPLPDRTFTSSIVADSIELEADVTPTEDEPAELKVTGQIDGLSGTSDGSMQAVQAYLQSFSNTSGAGSDGASFDGSFTYDSAEVVAQAGDTSFDFSMRGGNSGGTLDFDFTASSLFYGFTTTEPQVSYSGSDVPFPVEARAASSAFAIEIPVAQQPEPSDVALQIDYTDLVVNEAVWATFDPGQAIPRDPATLRLDISGLVQMTTSIMASDPAAFAGPPGELRSLSLNQLLVAAAGAELTGEGAVDFVPGTFPPQPVGNVNLSLSGLNTLLDRLTAAGLLPAEQASMARAMTGMFAQPGAGPDTLETTIEFLPGGGVTANGFPLQ